MSRFLTNREMYIYFKDCRVAKSHKLSGVLDRQCISLEFVGDLGESDGEVPQEKFADYVRTFGEHVNSESVENNLGNRMFTMVRKRF